jgi:hypothetical protein
MRKWVILIISSRMKVCFFFSSAPTFFYSSIIHLFSYIMIPNSQR